MPRLLLASLAIPPTWLSITATAHCRSCGVVLPNFSSNLICTHVVKLYTSFLLPERPEKQALSSFAAYLIDATNGLGLTHRIRNLLLSVNRSFHTAINPFAQAA